MVQVFLLHLYYSKLQNASTTTAHLHTLLARMFEKKMIRCGKMWDQTDGCAKQYSFSIAYYLMYFLSKSYKIVLNGAVDIPIHGKDVVDGFNSVQKRYLATCLRMRSTHEVDKIDSKHIRVDEMTEKGEVNFAK